MTAGVTAHDVAPPTGDLPARPRALIIGALALLLVATLVRLPYLPRLGNGYDLEAYRRWTAAIQDHGLAQVFERTDTDYVGYHYLLWGIGKGYGAPVRDVTVRDKRLRLWLKSPGIVGDVLTTVLVVGIAAAVAGNPPRALVSRRLRALAARCGLRPTEALALAAGALWALHPALIYTSAYWGQNDSLITAFALAALWAALCRRPAAAAALLAVGAVIKPQPMIISPALAWVVFDRSAWRGLIRAGVAGVAVLLLGHLYFIVNGALPDMARIYRDAVFTPQRLTFSAYNLWWPFAIRGDPTSSDTAFVLGGVHIAWGTLSSLLVVGVVAATGAGLARRRDDAGALLAAGYLVFGYFMVGSGAHERYDLPALAFWLPALPLVRSWALPLLVVSITITANAVMGIPLDRLYPQGEPGWLTVLIAFGNIAALCATTRLMLRGSTAPATQRAGR